MRIFLLLLALLPAATGLVSAASSGSGARATTGDTFGATMVVTADPQWKQKWGAPTNRLPRIPQTSSLRIGEKIWGLLFLTNPMPDADGAVDITCDLRMIRPNGKVTQYYGLHALRTKTIPVPRTYLSEFVLTMVGEADDPVGEWVLELVVHDENRGVEVPLTTRYTLLARE